MLMTYTGTCGSGKSYHATHEIIFHLKRGGVVVTNLELDRDKILKYHKKLTKEILDEKLIIVPNEMITPQFLYEISVKFIGSKIKHLLLIDEAADMFNSRDWAKADRKSWNKFFRMHRHLLYDVVLVTQHRKMIDKQVQYLFDVDVQHRNIKEYGIIGALCSIFLPKLFVCVGVYVPLKTRSFSNSVWLLKKYYDCYDTFTLSNYVDVDFFGGEDNEDTH